MVLLLVSGFRSQITKEREISTAYVVATPRACATTLFIVSGDLWSHLHQVRNRAYLEFLNTVVCFLVAGDPCSAGMPPFYAFPVHAPPCASQVH